MKCTIYGTVQNIEAKAVKVTVHRKHACQGCQASDICHAFSRPVMDFTIARPDSTLHIGDRVLLAIESVSFLKACIFAFMIPLVFIISAMAVANFLDLDVPIQAIMAIIAFFISLIIVRYFGKAIESPKIIEVIHEE